MEDMLRVVQWLKKCGKEIPESQITPEEPVKRLAVSLIFEELMELIEAWDMDYYLEHLAKVAIDRIQTNQDYPNKPKRGDLAVRDALSDLRVALGNAYAFSGTVNQAKKDFEQVMLSNESKIYPGTYEELKEEIDLRLEEYSKMGIKCIAVNTSENTCVILREHDSKILKPGSNRFVEPDLV